MKRNKLFPLLITFLLLSFCTSAEAYYTVIDLGTLPCYADSYAVAVNNKCQVVGFVGIPISTQAVRFVSSGSNVDLGTLGGSYSEATGNNNNGQIVGTAQNASGYRRATLFDATGNDNNQDLGTLAGYDSSFGEAINDNGKIVGSAYKSSSGTAEAILFNPSGQSYTIVALGTLSGHSYSEAYSINSSGQIVGKSMPQWGQHRATLFDSTGGGDNIDLGTVGGNYSQAKCINDDGEIVGNNIDLNTIADVPSGWRLVQASCINDNGWIVGFAKDSSGTRHGYLLIPEPATLLLLGLGAVLLRRKK